MMANMEKMTAMAYIFPGVSPIAIVRGGMPRFCGCGLFATNGRFAATAEQVEGSHL